MIDLKKKINVCEPLITKNAKKYINDCIDTEWISSAGKYLEDFEKNGLNIVVQTRVLLSLMELAHSK